MKNEQLLTQGIDEFKAENYLKAKELFEQILDFETQNHKVWYYLGEVYNKLGIAEKALEAYRKSADLKPEHSGKAWVNMGTIYVNLQMGKEAEMCYKAAVEKEPEHIEGWLHLGMFYYLINQPRKMLQPLKHALNHKPEDEVIIAAAALAYLQNRHYEEALKLYSKLHQLKPNDAKTLATLGEIEFILGDVDSSLLHLEKAVEIDTNVKENWLLLKRIYRKKGLKQKVKECRTQIKKLKR